MVSTAAAGVASVRSRYHAAECTGRAPRSDCAPERHQTAMAKKAARRAKPATPTTKRASAKPKPSPNAGRSARTSTSAKPKARPADDQKYAARADRGAGADVYLARLDVDRRPVAQALHDALMRAGAKGAAANGHDFACGLKWGYPAYTVDGAMAAQL